MRTWTEELILPEKLREGRIQKESASYTAWILGKSGKIQEKKRKAVIICPGGGYEHLSPREGEPIAMQYLSMGYHVFVIHYSLAPEPFPTALRELALLTAKIREHASEWTIDPEGIIVSGFSAGGHLALSLGVHWDKKWLYEPLGLTPEQIRPDGMILSYPVVTAGEGCHRGSVERLLWGRMLDEEQPVLPGGSQAEQGELRELISLEKHVGPHTPPAFLWHTVTDQTVPVRNSLLLAEALVKNGVSLEFHLYPVGRHGLALASEETADGQESYIEPQCQSWIRLAGIWLEHFQGGTLSF